MKNLAITLKYYVLALLLCAVSVSASAEVCTGKFPNPITDVCWECLFPISIGSIKLASGGQPDTTNPSSPICSCPNPFPRIGIATGFWEPARLVDVTKRPFCFVNLGGLSIDPGINIGTGKSPSDNQTTEANWHVHWYIYPLLYWLNLIVDFACLEASGFDIAYVTELDPLWQDDELTFLLNPEAVLFGNPIAQAACAADCLASTVHLPMDSLFWCAGCQGGMYPMNGRIKGHIGSVQSSLLAAERMTYKLHREGLAWGTSGQAALCQPYPMPIIKKSQYRSQLINPVATTGEGGCVPFGKTSTLYESGKEIPVIGEDFGFLIWRKRNCCAF
jgi:conjugal transfer pilus assembly protein TraU